MAPSSPTVTASLKVLKRRCARHCNRQLSITSPCDSQQPTKEGGKKQTACVMMASCKRVLAQTLKLENKRKKNRPKRRWQLQVQYLSNNEKKCKHAKRDVGPHTKRDKTDVIHVGYEMM